jgi:hypothetical protein
MKYFFLPFFLLSAIISSAQELIPYRGKTGWGFADTSGKVVIEPKPFSIFDIYNNNVQSNDKLGWPEVSKLILRNGKAVYVDSKGQEVKEYYTYNLKTIRGENSESTKYILISKWNKKNDSIYDEVDYNNSLHYMRSGYFIVGKKNQKGKMRWGVVDSTCHATVPIRYGEINSRTDFIFIDSSGFAGVYSYGGKEIIPCVYTWIYLEHPNFFVCSKDSGNEWLRSHYEPTDFRDSLGKILFSIKGACCFSDFSVDRIIGGGDSIRFYDYDGKWLFSIDTTARYLKTVTNQYVQFEKYKSWTDFDYRDIFVAIELYSRDGKFIRCDSTQEEILLDNGSILIREEHNEKSYPKIFPNKAHYLLIDSMGNEINEIQADTIEDDWSMLNKKTLRFTQNGKVGWISGNDGHIMIPAVYNLLRPRLTDNPEEHPFYSAKIGSENFRTIKDEGTYLIDTNGFVLAGPLQDLYFLNDTFYFQKNDSITFLDVHGKEIKKIEGSWLMASGIDGFLEISGDHGMGLLRMSDLEVIFPCIATDIVPVRNLFYAQINHEISGKPNFWLGWYIDQNGRNYIDPELLKEIPQ